MIQQYTTTGDVFADTRPQGAEIYIDDAIILDDMCKPLKTPIFILDVPKGFRKFTFRLPGYYSENIIVDVIGGATSDAFGVLFPKMFA